MLYFLNTFPILENASPCQQTEITCINANDEEKPKCGGIDVKCLIITFKVFI